MELSLLAEIGCSSTSDPGDLLVLAGRVGNALLMENRELREKVDQLEQKNHTLRLDQQTERSLHDGECGDFHSHINELTSQIRELKKALQDREADKRRSHTLLHQQLSEAWQEVDAMNVQTLRLTQKEQTLQRSFQTVSQQNTDLCDSLATLDHTLYLTRVQYKQQLQDAFQEIEATTSRESQLLQQMELFHHLQSFNNEIPLWDELQQPQDNSASAAWPPPPPEAASGEEVRETTSAACPRPGGADASGAVPEDRDDWPRPPSPAHLFPGRQTAACHLPDTHQSERLYYLVSPKHQGYDVSGSHTQTFTQFLANAPPDPVKQNNSQTLWEIRYPRNSLHTHTPTHQTGL